MTNFENIKSMNIEEMARYFILLYLRIQKIFITLD